MDTNTIATLERIVQQVGKYEIFRNQISISTPSLFVVDAVIGEMEPMDLVKEKKDSLAEEMIGNMLRPLGIDSEAADPEVKRLLLEIIDKNMRFHVTNKTRYTIVVAYMDFLVAITAARTTDREHLLQILKPGLVKALATRMCYRESKPLSDRIIGWKTSPSPAVEPHPDDEDTILKNVIAVESLVLALEANS